MEELIKVYNIDLNLIEAKLLINDHKEIFVFRSGSI